MSDPKLEKSSSVLVSEETASPAPSSQLTADVEKDAQRGEEPGKKWMNNEVQEIPQNNLWLVFPALMLTIFLAALDQTIAAVALPSIIRELGGVTGYSWVGSAYLLMSACLSPVYGKLTTIIGRKPLLFFSIFMFLFGSAMCGAAQNFIWLALSRGVQGIGGGGIIPMVFIVISDIVPMHARPKYAGSIGAISGIANVIGPLVGGSLTDHASWRWCFWINLPIGGIAALMLLLFLHTNPIKRRPVREVIAEFDLLGLLLIIGATVCLLLGFEFAETSWHQPKTIGLVVSGGVMFILAAINELFTPRSAIIPPRLFQTRTTAGVLIATFMHAVTFFAAAYYVPLYFQVLGSSATLSGIQSMPLSLMASVTAVLSGFILTKLGKYKPVLVFGTLFMTAGYGGMIVLDERSSKAVQEITLLIAGVGIGCLFQPPLIALQAAMPLKDMATSTATFNLVRTLGGTMGISIGGTIYASELARRIRAIPNFQAPSGDPVTGNIASLHLLQPIALREQVLHAYTTSLSVIWILFTPLAFVAFLSVLVIRSYSLQRAHVPGKAPGEKAVETVAPAPTAPVTAPGTAPGDVPPSSDIVKLESRSLSTENDLPKDAAAS